MAEPFDDAQLTEAWLIEEGGYHAARRTPTGVFLALQPQLYTTGLFRIRDTVGWECRWCYRRTLAAAAALLTWDGLGDDPPGPWIKQKGRNSEGRHVDRLNPDLAKPEVDFGC